MGFHMFKNLRRPQIGWALLVIVGTLSFSGCMSAPLLPEGALAWTRITARPTAAPPQERFQQRRVAALPPTTLADPPVASQDLWGALEAPDSPIVPVVRQTAADQAVNVAKPMVLPVNSATFDQHVLRSEVPVLVDFYADWCGPCKALAPALEQVAAENPQARVVKVNIDNSPELAARYNVKSVPRLLVFKGGQIAAQQNGVASKTRLNAMLAL
jgi:thioredoxin 1